MQNDSTALIRMAYVVLDALDSERLRVGDVHEISVALGRWLDAWDPAWVRRYEEQRVTADASGRQSVAELRFARTIVQEIAPALRYRTGDWAAVTTRR